GAPVPPSPGAAAGPAKRPSFQEAIDRLAQDVQQLRIDFERFMSGSLPFPPEELRGRIVAQLKTLRNSTITAAVDSFRLGDIEGRFNSYSELFNRRLREREEGRRRAVPPPPPPSRYDVERGIVFGARVEPEAVEALYQGLAAHGEAARFDLDSFQNYLLRQAASIRERTGCAEVQFRLAADEEGKIKLKARPMAAAKG
ncbi:MAG TPA: hypothetical protein VGE98_01765, partial [Thermoanaerobaculia bacterium]